MGRGCGPPARGSHEGFSGLSYLWVKNRKVHGGEGNFRKWQDADGSILAVTKQRLFGSVGIGGLLRTMVLKTTRPDRPLSGT